MQTRPGENCDEYPFASTLDADNGLQVSRCVPMGQNSRKLHWTNYMAVGLMLL
jgi:hypothetical protein